MLNNKKIKSFSDFFLDSVLRLLDAKTTSLNMMPFVATNSRSKEIVMHYIFYKYTEKNVRINDNTLDFIKPLIEKYSSWFLLRKEYLNNTNSINRDFKYLKNYDIYVAKQKMLSNMLMDILKKLKDLPLKTISEKLNISINTASKLRKGEMKVSAYKLLSFDSKNKL